ncbi:DeoR/GlpR family DNA-binding transcription regulator [Candidatus Halocynthiibacter alkanivorans]|uniref:DeoR/GlpR family DNA-binding transcription regulator n=1 Tax=Candidatus Halocynthiibacter alkanivorans TaxID=2267619 RepID=UPI000DF1EDA1|nr:DeoR/GlpR family DNA-binding transcription regulator [Candidatus Halocynthiibacter alkanivorans]
MQEKPEHSNHREQEILRELRLAGGGSRVGFLANRLGVSDETIRRNIKALEARALVRKVHGGVLLVENLTVTEPTFQSRMDQNAGTKQRLAQRVAEMISDGDSLFLDIGSTTAYVAEALSNHHNLYVVTNSLAVAHSLATRNNNRVFMAGGELRRHDGGAFGLEAINFIRRFNVRFAVFSVGAVNADVGFMLHDIQEADLSREAAARAQTRIVVADNEKFGLRAPIAIEDPASFDILVTDIKPAGDIADMLERNAIATVLPDSPPTVARAGATRAIR